MPLNTSGAPAALNLQNASLVEVVDILARALKINYILDPRVKGSVTINTYGEIKPVDVRPLLETILRINGAAMVQVGDLYRIVPIADVARLPISPQLNASGKDLPDEIIGVLRNEEGGTSLPAGKVWKIDQKQKKFVELPTEGLRCGPDGISSEDSGD